MDMGTKINQPHSFGRTPFTVFGYFFKWCASSTQTSVPSAGLFSSERTSSHLFDEMCVAKMTKFVSFPTLYRRSQSAATALRVVMPRHPAGRTRSAPGVSNRSFFEHITMYLYLADLLVLN